MLCASVLLAGCAARTGGYCDVARPMMFGSAATIDYLAAEDVRLLADIVAHNEKTAALCR